MDVKDIKPVVDKIFSEAGHIVIGQENMLRQIFGAVLCDANVLLEGYPGLAKTLSIHTMARLMDLGFSRIQGTPDLMPSDITGTYVLEERNGKRDFTFQEGPIFSNIILMDEINRATPKTQSALLEAMQEKQVTVGIKTFKLDRPFFVLATQNPIEQEGTYPLPEAQSDRFLLKVKVGYPTPEEEKEIVNRYAEEWNFPTLKPVINKNDITKIQRLVKQVPVANDIKDYIVKLIARTRSHKELIEFGASPRASIGLTLASKAHALMQGKNYVTKEDVKEMAFPVLRHRLILNFEAERNNFKDDDVIRYLLK